MASCLQPTSYLPNLKAPPPPPKKKKQNKKKTMTSVVRVTVKSCGKRRKTDYWR